MMESIEKLRKALKDCTSVSGVEPNQFDTYWITAAACDKYIDEIEREIAERYMELPVDADGVPCHIGDRMECDGCVFDIEAVGTDEVYDGDDIKMPPWYCSDGCGLHHVKSRTIEDVLKEFGDWYKHVAGGCDEPGIIAKYVDELRSMVVGE